MDQNMKLVIIMVGLPARGKSYISRKLARFLNWLGYNSKIFCQGVYRRLTVGLKVTNDYFDEIKNQQERDKITNIALDHLVEFLNGNGQVGIMDGTNTRIYRRNMVREKMKEIKFPYKLIFLETISNIESLIQGNINLTLMTSPDYNSISKEEALKDLNEKIKIFELVYEQMSKEADGDDATFIQYINQGKEIFTRNLRGYIESKLLSYLVNIHTGFRPIYFSRHGESVYNTKNLIGGDSELSPYGEKYGVALKKFFEAERGNFWKTKYQRCKVFCSTMKRTIQTAQNLKFLDNPTSLKNLDEINVGICDGISYKDFEVNYPEEFALRSKDKLRYRYPRGESYLDMIHRIEHVIYELERQDGPVIVIGHQGILRALYGYFASIPIDDIPVLDIPLHTVIKFTPHAYGFYEERIVIDPETSNFVIHDSMSRKISDTLLDNSKELHLIYK